MSESLPQDVLLLICLFLTPEGISALRQTCRNFNYAIQNRALWLTLLRRLVSDGAIIPSYVPQYEHLDVAILERLVRYLTPVAWDTVPTTRAHNPARILTALRMPLSVTWLRLVAGNWLFVAASNDFTSRVTCYDLADSLNIAYGYLPGLVKTGEVEIQDGSIVLALGLSSGAVHVLTLRKRTSRNVLCQLAIIKGSSHVLALCGSLVGCAIRAGRNVPHLCDWRKNMVYELPSPPGGHDVPSRRSVPHRIVLWQSYVVVVRASGLELYRYQFKPAFLKLYDTPTIWEAARVAPDRTSASLRIAIISPNGIELLLLRDLGDGIIDCALRPLFRFPTPSSSDYHPPGQFRPPFYGLRTASGGRRIFWLSAQEAASPYHKRPHIRLLHASIPRDDGEASHVFVDFEGMRDPGIWGDAVVDFDDSLGFIAIGNCFGEVTLYSHVLKRLSSSSRLTIDFADVVGPRLPLISPRPIPLNRLRYPHMKMSPSEIMASRASRWASDYARLNLPERESWRRAAYHDFFAEPLYSHLQDQWEGAPGDLAWFLERMYGFPGDVLPQAYKRTARDVDAMYESVVLRIGDHYLCQSPEWGPYGSWPHTTSPGTLNVDGHPDLPRLGARQEATRQTAETVWSMFATFMLFERMARKPRNRWDELVSRGGYPPAQADFDRSKLPSRE
ncbi:hypothetical protein MKEN_00238000 [Mycena kentingensis (nom. inval.)]|nr:hypothetical protein MKEN_00238000 [Mycena kentingensis (nom. inval.)]